jgi:lysine 2,3-aminomutase
MRGAPPIPVSGVSLLPHSPKPPAMQGVQDMVAARGGVALQNGNPPVDRAVTEPEELAALLEVDAADLRRVHAVFPLRLSRHVLDLIERPGDPIWRQFVPDVRELEGPGAKDPLHEAHFTPVCTITHRYPDRVLFCVTYQCAAYCRFCTRKHRVANPAPVSQEDIDQGVAYIRQHTEVRDVILSGGDPLMLSNRRLEAILRAVRSIPHVEIIRIGTRIPVTWPQRVTPGLCRMLRRFHPLYVNTHFNHPREITPESSRACGLLADASIPLGNQSVLLRGVNDRPDVMKELVQKLLTIRVRPYYIYQADLVRGTDHFRTSVQMGLNIIRALWGHTSGLAVPHYVIDAPRGGGKVALIPDAVVAFDEHEIALRNFEGEVYRYPSHPGRAEDATAPREAPAYRP